MLLYLLICFLHLYSSNSSQSYSRMLTHLQLRIILRARILQYSGKRCVVKRGQKASVCKQYCQINYQYVPSLPYKNAQKYNPLTGLCQPKTICPKLYGIKYDEKTDTCKDMLTGQIVPGINAQENLQGDKINAKFICQNGKVIVFNGLVDCQCDLGYTTRLQQNLITTKPQFKKCNEPIHISLYYPNTLKVYYDPNSDNYFPHANNPDYWLEVVAYYMRNLKYGFHTFFQPYEAQMANFILPKEQMISDSDWVWFIWIILILFFILGLSIYQKIIHGSRVQISNK